MTKGLKVIKYHLVHLPSNMTKVTDMKLQFTVQYVSYIPDIILMVALGLGLYTQWTYTGDTTISIIAMLGVFVFAVSCALQYYFSLQNVGKSLFHIWIGCLLGIIAFTNNKDFEYVTTQEVMEILFMTSLVFGWFWNILQRLLHLIRHEASFLSQSEALECLGLILGSLVTGIDAAALSFLILAYAVHLTAMRMKSLLGLLSFLVFIIVGTFVFFPDLKLNPNKYALICFIGRHTFQPIIDFYFSNLTMLERWRTYFNQSKFIRHSASLFVFGLDLALAVLIGQQSTKHKEWFVVVPIFAVFAVLWLLFHVIYTLCCWKLMSKITDCNWTYQSLADEQQSYNRIMAAKGIRHVSLISQRLIFLSLATTVILVGIGWETRSAYSLSLSFIVLPIEAMTLSLFWELGDFLGGTCTGYAIVAPVTSVKQDGTAKLLSSAALQDMTSRATSTLNHMHKFFSFHMVDNYGCDYSTSGLGPDYVENKLKAFFDRRTADGPRFDTYIVYYTGDVYDNGEWALADNKNLKVESLLEWWSLKNAGSGARLIIVLDTLHSFSWTKSVRYCVDEYIAIQSCKYTKLSDPELGGKCQIGSFTDDWVNYNLGVEIDEEWESKTRSTKAVYTVSKYWTDFTFHLPTKEDFAQYWDTNFPKVTKPLIKAVNLPSAGILFCFCDCVMRCIRRKQMMWLPPKEIDTGHGFKLVRS